MTPPPFACNYAALRFLPYRETGEFVNLGVVLLCEQTGTFDYRLETERTGRVTDFFPEVNVQHFIQTRNFMEEELKRIRTHYTAASQRPADPTAFLNLVRPRESIFQFSGIGTLLADAPTESLDRLFHNLVTRQITQPTV